MAEANPRARVTAKLAELQEWAEYVFESLVKTMPGSAGPGLLNLYIGTRDLRELRELSWMLREKLYRAKVHSEFNPPADEAAATPTVGDLLGVKETPAGKGD